MAGTGPRGLPGFKSLVTHCMGQSSGSVDLETLTSVGLVACHSRLYEADLCLNSVLVSTLQFHFSIWQDSFLVFGKKQNNRKFKAIDTNETTSLPSSV